MYVLSFLLLIRIVSADAFSIGGRNKASINFINSSDEKQVQLKMKGDWLDMTTEIKWGDTVVARIDREMRTGWQILGGPQTYFVMIAPNVDMALMVAACICLDERRRSN